MIIDLDKNFTPLTGEVLEYESFVFAGGEPHIKIRGNISQGQVVSVTHRFNSFDAIGVLLVAVDALKRMGATLDTLVIPYFPGARQDRLMITGEPLTVKIYAQLFNNLGFKRIVVFDPHSEVAPALIDNCVIIPNFLFVKEVLQQIGKDVLLVSPDGGALKKIYKLSEFLGGKEVIECSKSRDVKTGKLKEFIVYDNDLKGKDCLIVDDICDGGGTFIGLAEELKKKNAGKLYLALSHGIFSKGFNVLEKHFEKIYTTNSFRDVENEKVDVIKLKF